jgi:hypothetical protein
LTHGFSHGGEEGEEEREKGREREKREKREERERERASMSELACFVFTGFFFLLPPFIPFRSVKCATHIYMGLPP